MMRLSVVSLLLAFAIFLTGCASLPHSTTQSINNQRIQFALTQHNTVPVIFENGLGGRMEWWKKVIPLIAADTTTLAYNRAGYGASTPATTPRDGEHIVEELRALLHSQGLNPPYILVGHSLGGLYMQLFARRYPNEVSALILVDSTHPKQQEGEGDLRKQPWWVRALLAVLITGTAKQELEQQPQTGAQVLSLPTFNKSVFVLSAAQPLKLKSAIADDANAKRKEIAQFYPNSRQIWLDSGHGIPLEKPEAIAEAIRDALKATRVNTAP